jgi:hypothetical protein
MHTAPPSFASRSTLRAFYVEYALSATGLVPHMIFQYLMLFEISAAALTLGLTVNLFAALRST